MRKDRNTLIIVAHMDDETFSCGGLIQARIRAQQEVCVMTLFGRNYDYGRISEKTSRKDEEADFLMAMQTLAGTDGWYATHLNAREGEPFTVGYQKLLQRIEEHLHHVEPTEVVIPSAHDMNQDHRLLNDVCQIALRPANLGGVRRILEAHAFDAPLVTPTYFVPMTERQVDRKIMAAKCYRREYREGVHTRSRKSIRAMHRVLGSKCGHSYAEGYTLRMVVEGEERRGCEFVSQAGVGSSGQI